MADMLRQHRRFVLFLVLFALIILIALLPLRAVLADDDDKASFISARHASGSIWSGKILDLHAGGLKAGDVGASLSFWPLFLGKAQLSLNSLPGQAPVTAIVEKGLFSSGVRNLTAELPFSGSSGLPVESWQFSNFQVRFAAGQCDSASGNVRIMPEKSLKSLLRAEQGLMGRARCEGGRLVLPLASQSSREKLVMRIDGNGNFEARLSVASGDPGQGAMLRAAGFTPYAEGWYLNRKGNLNSRS